MVDCGSVAQQLFVIDGPREAAARAELLVEFLPEGRVEVHRPVGMR
jgi:hypothetical protein